MVKKVTVAPFWTALSTTPAQYPWLDRDLTCQVAVVGGGMAAAMCALRFAEAGIDTALFSASPIGSGSTASASGILSVDGEDSLFRLSERIGADRAMMTARLMQEALDQVEKISSASPDGCGFRRSDSLRFTASGREKEAIRREYALRLHSGLNSELIGPSDAGRSFTFPIAAGVYSTGMAAQVDPYRLCHAVISRAAAAGAHVYENTGVTSLSLNREEEAPSASAPSLALTTTTHRRVQAEYVIMATGTDTRHLCRGTARTDKEWDEIRTTYLMATEPVEELAGWRGACVIRREEEPRLYLSVTPDRRLLIGGLDSLVVDEQGRVAGLWDLPRHEEHRWEELEETLRDMFPAIRDITPSYVFAARDARTKDGLPVIGRMAPESRLPATEQVAYALCGGDNGILHAEIAGRLLLDQYQGRDNRELGLFSPGRAWRIKH